MKKKNNGWVGMVSIVAILVLSILFWLDDATVIGELIDPIEFIIIATIGYYGGLKSKKR